MITDSLHSSARALKLKTIMLLFSQERNFRDFRSVQSQWN